MNGALLALPIPSFTVPPALGIYGLPAGAKLGITNPALTVVPQHFVLRGAFGVVP